MEDVILQDHLKRKATEIKEIHVFVMMYITW